MAYSRQLSVTDCRLGQGQVTLYHFQVRMSQQALQGEHIAPDVQLLDYTRWWKRWEVDALRELNHNPLTAR